MDVNSEIDVFTLRDEFESNTEWKMRKKFLDMNLDKLPLQRLVCLSRCFVNITMYGCTYPRPVMSEVNERSGGLVETMKEDKKTERKQAFKDSFVKPEADSCPENSEVNESYKGVVDKMQEDKKAEMKQNFKDSTVKPGPDKRPGNKYIMMSFVKSSETLNPSSDNSEQSTDSQLQSFKTPTQSPGMPPSVMSTDSNSENQHSGSDASSSFGLSQSVSSRCFKVPEAKPILSKEEYFRLLKTEKDVQLVKFRKLVHEVMTLNSDRPNAIDKLMSACNRVPIKIDFDTEIKKRFIEGKDYFSCNVFIDSVIVAFGEGMQKKDAKVNAHEVALQNLFMPHLRIVSLKNNTKELQASKKEFTTAPSGLPTIHKITPSSVQAKPSVPNKSPFKETNYDPAIMKRRGPFDFKPLEEFVIVEPMVQNEGCTPVHTLRRSADFNRMIIEYEYSYRGGAARCVLKIENRILADLTDSDKLIARNMAADQAMFKLRQICWVLKTKQTGDSDAKLSKDEMLNELDQSSDVIGNTNVGHKLLSKMGWAGGGVGKDGHGIAEPVSMKSVFNREGLGLSAKNGITTEFRQRVKEVVEEYAASNNQEDLVFDSGFSNDERQIIHNMCRRLNLKSKSYGKGKDRHLCVSRKRTAFELFRHIMASGGETPRYQLVPPTGETSGDQLPFSGSSDISHQYQMGPSDLMQNSFSGSNHQPSIPSLFQDPYEINRPGGNGATFFPPANNPMHSLVESGFRKRRGSDNGPRNGNFRGQKKRLHDEGAWNGCDTVGNLGNFNQQGPYRNMHSQGFGRGNSKSHRGRGKSHRGQSMRN